MLWRRLTSIFSDERRSNTDRSASYPSAILPFFTEKEDAGVSAPIEAAWDSGIVPARTISMTIGIDVSTPGIPPGAATNSCALSSIVWGA